MLTTRDVYRAATLLPFVGLVIAAALDHRSSELPAGWDFVYPTSITRGLLVYSVLAAWLWIQIRRRPPKELRRRIWWMPVWYVALGWLMMLALTLLRGEAGELWAEQSGAILTRTAVHLFVGYAYLGLLHLAITSLRRGGALADGPDGDVS